MGHPRTAFAWVRNAASRSKAGRGRPRPAESVLRGSQFPCGALLPLWVFLDEANKQSEEVPALPIEELGDRTHQQAGHEAGSMKCRPHRWNIEDWLPLYGKPVEKSYSEFWCLDCGRVLAVRGHDPKHAVEHCSRYR